MSEFLFYLILGGALVAIELILLSFTVFWFLFFGVGALIAATCAWFFPELGWTYTTAIFLVASLVTAFLLYRPIKRWQDKPSPIAGHDAIGQTVDVLEDIAPNNPGNSLWSGTNWQTEVVTGDTIKAGQRAEIVRLEGIRLFVKPLGS